MSKECVYWYYRLGETKENFQNMHVFCLWGVENGSRVFR